MAKGAGGQNVTGTGSPQNQKMSMLTPQWMANTITHKQDMKQGYYPQNGQQATTQPVGQPQVQQPPTNAPWGDFKQRMHNMTDWWSVMRSQNPTDYFASMYKAQQPAPTPTTTTPVSTSSQGLLSTPYNPNTGMPI